MNKRKLERQYQRLLKKNKALKGALINCAIQVQTTLDRHGDELSLGQQQWYMGFLEYVQDITGQALPKIECFTFDMEAMSLTEHEHYQDGWCFGSASQGTSTFVGGMQSLPKRFRKDIVAYDDTESCLEHYYKQQESLNDNPEK